MDHALVSAEETKLHHSLTMRKAHISHDSCDSQGVALELAKGMSQPAERYFIMLKRAGRHLLARTRDPSSFFQCNAQSLKCPHSATRITLGCFRRCRSMARLVIMFGCAELKICSSRTGCDCSVQCRTRVLWHDGRSERIAGRKEVRHGSWSQAGVVDIDRCRSKRGHQLSHGHRSSEHLATSLFWVQDFVSRETVKIKKVQASEKVSDILAKAVPSSTILKMLELMNHRFVSGRAGLALTV